MDRIARNHRMSTLLRAQAYVSKQTVGPSLSRISRLLTPSHARYFATVKTNVSVPQITAPDLIYAQKPDHVDEIHHQLQHHGILKISLQFADTSSTYLKHLLRSLHDHHGHQLPISHSAKRGWFWDVRPNETTFQAGNHQARSETMNEFPWHTDCSYEDPPPRYFALQVLQHDRYGGGTLSIMNVDRLSALLSPATRAALVRPEYRISIPPEFIKDPAQKHILGSVLLGANAGGDGGGRGRHESTRPAVMRFREDILTPLSSEASAALGELKGALRSAEIQAQSTLHLVAEELPKGSIILVDNRRWLHARNHINDPERHLRRVRWDAVPFSSSD
ncbi:unnamed protein product [Clonostachys byssicola]|uniref:TauD/TfdA-like domain-containing protein n=1 Tax=Clonostachys byssicola TaxID=160290 RepID=A0A9N9U017_9HYPO|nr:unnamed protein product [Clonostachys byssicola]